MNGFPVPATVPKRHARRLVWRVGVPALVLLASAGATVPWVRARAEPPLPWREAATAAVERARSAGAATWAAADLMQAEATLYAALREERRQQLRFILRRDFATARNVFELSRHQAERCLAHADRARTKARDDAGQDLQDAEAAVARAQTLLGGVPLGKAERAALREARIALDTARRLHDGEQFGQVGPEADRARRRSARAVEGAGAHAARFADRGQVGQWQRWIRDTITWSKRKSAAAIVVYKEKNRLDLYHRGRIVRSYRADMGTNVTRTKLHAGDRATPEGRYRITTKKDLGRSVYHKALLLDYPNDEDRRRYRALVRQGRVPAGAGLGGLIEIHGEGGRGDDWTKGCVALSNPDMDHLFARVEVGTPVTIVGGDGRDGPFSDLARDLARQANGRAEP
jgi:hypothetical protein